MIRFDWKSPIGAGSSLMAGFTAWASSGFLTDPKHLGLAATAAIASAAATNTSASKPNVAPESHIITPYVNNVVQTKE